MSVEEVKVPRRGGGAVIDLLSGVARLGTATPPPIMLMLCLFRSLPMAEARAEHVLPLGGPNMGGLGTGPLLPSSSMAPTASASSSASAASR